ncbi:MAG: zinc-ribbon domain-containing protein, partial [Gemmatimonadales bacterium]
MNVSCTSCETVYRVDPAKVPAGGVRARCAVCSNVFSVEGPGVARGGGVGTAGKTAPRPPPPAPPSPPIAP